MADDLPIIPDPRTLKSPESECLEEIHAVLKRRGMSLAAVATQIRVSCVPQTPPDAPGSPPVDSGSEDGA